jgi:predicted transcriptional regulator
MLRAPTPLQLNIYNWLLSHGGWVDLTTLVNHQISEKGAVYRATHTLIERGWVEKRKSNLTPLYRAVIL